MRSKERVLGSAGPPVRRLAFKGKERRLRSWKSTPRSGQISSVGAELPAGHRRRRDIHSRHPAAHRHAAKRKNVYWCAVPAERFLAAEQFRRHIPWSFDWRRTAAERSAAIRRRWSYMKRPQVQEVYCEGQDYRAAKGATSVRSIGEGHYGRLLQAVCGRYGRSQNCCRAARKRRAPASQV